MSERVATVEFCDWLKTTSFAGVIRAGEQWDTEEAWPDDDAMESARKCYDAFMAGFDAVAEEDLHQAQAALVACRN